MTAQLARFEISSPDDTTLAAAVLMPPTNNGWVTKALIADPAGNVISLIHDTPAR